MNATDKAALSASVATVAKAWDKSPYYANAERLTSIFWNPKSPFLERFNQLDLTNVVELASGHGRHAEQCADRCGHLTLVEIFDDNLAASAERLKAHTNISYLKNNGYDFEPLPAEAFTAIYSYDAMVHFAPDVVASYLRDGRRILKPGGLMLLHHSNYEASPPDRNYGTNPGARNHMPYERFTQFAADAGLEIVETRALPCGVVPDIDRITMLRKPSG